MNNPGSSGVTSAHHNNTWYDFLFLRRLHQSGRLRLRVYASPPLKVWPRGPVHLILEARVRLTVIGGRPAYGSRASGQQPHFGRHSTKGRPDACCPTALTSSPASAASARNSSSV